MLLSGYGEMLLEAGKGIHFALKVLWEQQTEALMVVTDGDSGVFGYFQGDGAAKWRDADKKKGELVEQMATKNNSCYKDHTKDVMFHWAIMSILKKRKGFHVLPEMLFKSKERCLTYNERTAHTPATGSHVAVCDLMSTC